MFRFMSWLAILVALSFGAASVVPVLRGQSASSYNLHGEAWPHLDPLQLSSTEIVALDANASENLSITMSDERILNVSQQGVQVEETGTVAAEGARSAFTSDGRWVINPPRATLLDKTGQKVRVVSVPRRAVSSVVLSNGDLGFVTPDGPTLVSIVNRSGVTTAQFGKPMLEPNAGAPQNRWLNHGILLETRRGELALVFSHQPHPTVRRYTRSGTLLGEFTLRSPGLDDVAAGAIEAQKQPPDDCSGGRITVFSAAYDSSSDTLWITTATDDALGYVRVVTTSGTVVTQVQLKNAQNAEPAVPTAMAFGAKYLYWVSGRQTWRADVSELRNNLRAVRNPIAMLMAKFVTRVEAREACGSGQELIESCPYTCPRGGTLTCSATNKGPGWVLESQHCLQPPTSPANFKGCEKSASWCEIATEVRQTLVDRQQCPPATDNDSDGYWAEEGDCNDNNPSINPGAYVDCHTMAGPPSACPNEQDVNCNGNDCIECNLSPIVVDVLNDGVRLTSAGEGVAFDLTGDGSAEGLSWTEIGSDDGWLALDRNNNGIVDDGKELFGNFTPQPAGLEPNGFLALAIFDTTAAGGNNDGWIDARDAVFSKLRVWQDRNHDGSSQSAELLALRDAGVTRISLDYRQSSRRDRWGNEFRYRAKVESSTDNAKWAYDVFLVRNW